MHASIELESVIARSQRAFTGQDWEVANGRALVGVACQSCLSGYIARRQRFVFHEARYDMLKAGTPLP